MGFYDALNPSENWFASSYLAIDQGPIICMIENYRSGLLWDYFMRNEEITIALEKIGFTEDGSLTGNDQFSQSFIIYPNPSEGIIYIKSDGHTDRILVLTDLSGKRVPFSSSSRGDLTKIQLPESQISGLIYLSVISGAQMTTKKLFLNQ
jgi:hypothetical protein